MSWTIAYHWGGYHFESFDSEILAGFAYSAVNSDATRLMAIGRDIKKSWSYNEEWRLNVKRHWEEKFNERQRQRSQLLSWTIAYHDSDEYYFQTFDDEVRARYEYGHISSGATRLLAVGRTIEEYWFFNTEWERNVKRHWEKQLDLSENSPSEHLERHTLLIQLACSTDIESLNVIEYDSLWSGFDTNSLVPMVLTQVAKNVMRISRKRKALQARYPNLEENNIFVDTMAFVAAKLLKSIGDRQRSVSSFTESTYNDYLRDQYSKLEPYARNLRAILERLEASRDSLPYSTERERNEIILDLREQIAKYQWIDFESFVWACAREISETFSFLLEGLDNARYTPLQDPFAGSSVGSMRSDDRGKYEPILTLGSDVQCETNRGVVSGRIHYIRHRGTAVVFDVQSKDGRITRDVEARSVRCVGEREEAFSGIGHSGMVFGRAADASRLINSQKRMSPDFLSQDPKWEWKMEGNEWGKAEQKLMTVDLGEDIQVSASGYLKGSESYSTKWENFDYSSLPTSVLQTVTTSLKQIAFMREFDLGNYPVPDPGHVYIYVGMLNALESAEKALKRSDPSHDAAKMTALQAKRATTLANRIERLNLNSRDTPSNDFLKLNGLLQSMISGSAFGVKSSLQRSLSFSLSGVHLSGSSTSLSSSATASRERSSYDYFRSSVWSRGSGSRSDMLSSYYEWKGQGKSAAGGAAGGGGGGGGGVSFNMSNVVVY